MLVTADWFQPRGVSRQCSVFEGHDDPASQAGADIGKGR